MKYHDESLLKELEVFIKNGDIIIESNNIKYYDELKKLYPCGQSQIEWEKVESKYEMFSKNIHTEKEIAAIDFLLTISTDHNIKENQEIIYFGDIIDIALHMKYSCFIKNIKVLLSYPQDCYVVPITFEWCFNCLFEDDFYFGFTDK